MKFEAWIKACQGRHYRDILQDLFTFEDPEYFDSWAAGQRLSEFSAADWGMLSIVILDERNRMLEKRIASLEDTIKKKDGKEK